MVFAQFYHMSTGYIPGTIPPEFGQPTLIPACGDRAIIVIDGRLLQSFQNTIARQECIKRGYLGYSLHKGDTLNRSVCIQELREV